MKLQQTKSRWLFIPALLLASAAHAQSSVTLYGLIDEGLNFTSNAGGHSAYQMKSGDFYGSRWGVRGSEDLGDGYRAIFRLEGGFNASNGEMGEGSREFGRQAYAGIASDRYGTLTVGRQYDPTSDENSFGALTAAGNWAGDLAAHPFDNDNADWDFRVNNSVKYVSPSYHGLTAEGMYAFSNEAGAVSNNSLYGGSLNYQNGGLTAAASYMKMNHPGENTSGAVTGDTLFTGASEQSYGAGVSYKFSKQLLAFIYSHVDVYDPTSNSYFTSNTGPDGGTWNSWKFDNFEINDQYFFRPNFWLGASYTFTYAHLASSVGSFDPKWHQLSLTLDYDLSKQTSVYVQGAYQHVVSAHTGTDFDYASNVADAGMSSSENQMVYRVALLHRF